MGHLQQIKTVVQRGASRQAPARGARRVAAKKAPRQWPKPNWQLLRRLSLAALLLALLLSADRGWQLLEPHVNRPISTIRVLGELSAVNQQAVQEQLMPYSSDLFLSVDIGAVRHALETLPWIASAEVSRIWPDQLQVIVQEELPVARWGKDSLLSTQGHLFSVPNVELYGHLPMLVGPEKTQQRVMQQYLTFSQALRPLGYSVKRLEMRERGSWFVTTQTGLQLLFGRDHLVEKMRRFVMVHEQELKQQINTVERVDLRYANGLAVAWRAPTESDTTAVVAQ